MIHSSPVTKSLASVQYIIDNKYRYSLDLVTGDECIILNGTYTCYL
jgi:hypothetical protein